MKIRTYYVIENDVYQATLYTEDWSERDIQLMQRFGEPEIDLGGDIPDDYPDYTLEHILKRIKTESPFVQEFDQRDYADAETRAETWASTIQARIAAAVIALRAHIDTFTTEQIQEI